MHGGKIVVPVLSPLPVGDVRLHAEQTALHLTNGLVGRNRDDIQRQQQIPVQVAKLGHHAVLNIAGVFPQKDDAAKKIAHSKMIFFKLERIRANVILEIMPLAHCFGQMETKVRFLADPKEIMENAQTVSCIQLDTFGTETGKMRHQFGSDPREILTGFLYIFLDHRNGNVLFLNRSVRADGLCEQHLVVLLPVHIKMVLPKRNQNRAFKIGRFKRRLWIVIFVVAPLSKELSSSE